MFLKSVVVFSVGIGLISASVVGAEDGLTRTDAIFQRIEKKGSRTLRTTVPLAEAEPGEELSHVITYSNTGKKPVQDVVMTAPVPPELEYISTSIIKTGETDASFEVSVDGGKEYQPLPVLTVISATGESRRAQARDVTHVQWRLKSSVAEKENIYVLLRGRVKVAIAPPSPAPSPP